MYTQTNILTQIREHLTGKSASELVDLLMDLLQQIMGKQKFVAPKTFLGKTVYVEIDRPLGSRHPKWGFVYSVNYGFVPNQPAPDGEDLDAYVLGVFEPLANFTGKCIAVVHRTDDDDDKLVLVPEGVEYTDAQIMALVEFQERFFESTVVRL